MFSFFNKVQHLFYHIKVDIDKRNL